MKEVSDKVLELNVQLQNLCSVRLPLRMKVLSGPLGCQLMLCDIANLVENHTRVGTLVRNDQGKAA